MKRIAILGSTGSIGQNCLNVVDNLSDQFEVAYLTTNNNVQLLLEQARKYRPRAVVVVSTNCDDQHRRQFENIGVKVLLGPKAMQDIVQVDDYDLLINSVVGAAGFVPTLRAIEVGKDIALANKETLVVGGELVMAAARAHDVAIVPIDSEHSAIFQCLMGEEISSVENIILTASGGPFRTLEKERFREVTVAQALRHPNWKMGKKITIDSATMMNKGLEIIEAHWLFGLPVEKVRVVIHPQSIIHSMVAFCDGSVKAQMGMPDMRVPIQFAMTYPERKPAQFPQLDFAVTNELTFEEPDLEKFTAISLAYQAAKTGGTAPAVMNAANEVAVALFLEEKIRFDMISEIIEDALQQHKLIRQTTVDDLIESDRWAREFVQKRFDT